jgi:hypothetical protein
MEPWQSWAIVVTCAVGGYLYYRPPGASKEASAHAQTQPEEASARSGRRREDSKAKKRPNAGAKSYASALSSDAASANEAPKKRNQGKKAAASKPATPKPVERVPAASSKAADEKDEDENREWAERLAGLKKGTNLQPPTRNENRTKTVKQGAANRSADVSAASSTGAEADDDLSPAVSPALGASQPSGNDVSDMLEAPKAGPSVLRVTPSTEPERPKKQHQPKAAPEKESKKQRQNRRKNEERKAQAAEDEQARRVLLERQRKSAREARGEPAKNGVASSPAPASNAWTEVKKSAAAAPAQTSVPVNDNALLDTFEQSAVPTTTSGAAGTSKPSATGTTWGREVPSEEEQMRMINEMEEDSSWNTVPKGRKGKKKNVDAGEAAGNESNAEAPAVQPPASAPAEEKKAANDSNPYASLTNGSTDTLPKPASYTTNRHPNDSDWAVV